MHRLELRGITKLYPAVRANDGVDLVVEPGEIHAVLGENGAGKSTLMKIIYGAVQADAGELSFNGVAVRVASPAQARALGISMVYQHFSLFDSLTVAENVALGLGRRSRLADVAARISAVAAGYGLDIDPARPVHTLGVGERQRVEIVRALLGAPQLLILDEPTSVLTPQAVAQLFVTLRMLAASGCSLLYISHKLDEIRALCQRCTVLRGGRVAGVCDPRLTSEAELSRLMIGAEPPALPPRLQPADPAAAPVLRVQNLTLGRLDPYGHDLHGIELQVGAGEIVGIAGVSGNGQQELMAALSGEDPRAAAGCVLLNGRDLVRHNPRQRRALGLHSVPEERLGRGTVPALSLAQNTLLTREEALSRRWLGGGWIASRALQRCAEGLIARFTIKAAGAAAPAQSLSGGNLQKFIVGREIEAAPRLLLISQPTWGVDVGAAAQIRAELLRLRDAGCALLLVSEELDELFALSDRLVVMARGRLSPALPTAQASTQQIGRWMSGLWPGRDAAARVASAATDPADTDDANDADAAVAPATVAAQA